MKKYNENFTFTDQDVENHYNKYFERTKKKITKILEKQGCTNIEFEKGSYFFCCYFTSESGQIWYLSNHEQNNEFMYRKSKGKFEIFNGQNFYKPMEQLRLIKFI